MDSGKTRQIVIFLTLATRATTAAAQDYRFYDIHQILVLAKTKIGSAQYSDASRLYGNALQRIGRTDTPSRERAEALNGLAVTMQMTGRLSEAEKLYTRAIQAAVESGANFLETGNMRNNLASLYYHTNRLDDAESLHRQLLAERERISGADSVLTAITLNNLAEVVRFRGRAVEARALAERSVAILEQHLDTESQSLLADSLHTLGIVCSSMQDAAGAVTVLERARGIRQRTLGPGHPRVADTLVALASVYTSEGRFVEAEQLLRTALPVVVQGGMPLNTVAAYHNLAQVYRLSGRYADAEPLYKRAITIARQSGRVTERSYVLSLSAYAEMLSANGRVESALQTFAQALRTAERRFGPDDPDTVAVGQALASFRTRLLQATATVTARALASK